MRGLAFAFGRKGVLSEAGVALSYFLAKYVKFCTGVVFGMTGPAFHVEVSYLRLLLYCRNTACATT